MKSRYVLIAIAVYLIASTSCVFGDIQVMLIGIDTYPGLVKALQLEDTGRNGVNLMEQLLQNRFKLDDVNIKKLVNKDATLAGIKDALNSYIGMKKSNGEKMNGSDVLLIYYCGHGTVVKSKDKDETYDEAIVCYDYCDAKRTINGVDYSPKNVLLDDVIGKTIDKIKANGGPKVIFIADTCHSGTMTRGTGSSKPDILCLGILGIKWPWEDSDEIEVSLARQKRNMSADVTISACMDDKEAYAKSLLTKSSGGYVGLLTYNLYHAFDSNSRNMTYRTLGKLLTARVKGQTPRVNGSVSDLFLKANKLELLQEEQQIAKSPIADFWHGKKRSVPGNGSVKYLASVYIEGFDDYDKSEIEDSISNTFINQLDTPPTDNGMLFRRGDQSQLVGCVLDASKNELWQTPPVYEASELGDRLYCYAALGRIFPSPEKMLSKDSTIQPKLRVGDSAVRYASVWPEDEGFAYMFQIDDKKIPFTLRLSVQKDCYGFIAYVDKNGLVDILSPSKTVIDPKSFGVGDTEITRDKKTADDVNRLAYLSAPGRDVVFAVLFPDNNTAQRALETVRKNRPLTEPLFESCEVDFLLMDSRLKN